MASKGKPIFNPPQQRPPQQPQQRQVIELSEQYSGPMPHPAILSGYQSMVPDAPERILKVFEQDSEHTRIIQAKALDAQISKDLRGQWMAFAVIIGGMTLTAWVAYLGKDAGAILSGLTTVIAAAAMFYQRGKRNQ